MAWNMTIKGHNSPVPSNIVARYSPSSGCSEDFLVNCGNHSILFTGWMLIANDIVHFYFLPCVIGLGILLAFVNCVVLLRQMRMSVDCYILGMVIATLLLLLCSVVINIRLYVGHLDFIAHAYGYVKSSRNWFWYVTIWLLVIACLERCANLSATRSRVLCTPFQAGITVAMAYLACLASALPHYWEYEARERRDPLTNLTIMIAVKTRSTETPEYNVMYFWYVTAITVFVPPAILLVLLIVLCCGMKRPVASKRQLSVKHSTGQVMKRKVTEEIRLTQLLISFIMLYILLTSPYNAIKLAYRFFPGVAVPTDPLFATLEKLFQLLFYLNYTLHFIFLLIFNWAFRKTCINTCCCCCCADKEVNYELAPHTNSFY